MQGNHGIRRFCGILSVISLLLISSTSFSQNKKYSFLPKNGERLKYQWGLPSFEVENSRSEAAKKFKFSYYRVAGCTLESIFEKYCKKHNKKLYRKISGEYGSGWQEAFEKEVTGLYLLFRFADTLSMQSEFFWEHYMEVINRLDSLHRTGKIPYGDLPLKYFEKTNKDSVLLIKVCSANGWIDNKLVV